MLREARSTLIIKPCVILLLAGAVLAGCSGGSSAPEPELVQLPAARGLEPALNYADNGFNEAHFAGAGACSTCHNDEAAEGERAMVDSMGRDLSINKAWESSTMANSARDPYWHAVVATELATYPSRADEITDTCTRCHAPMANEVARKEGLEFQLFDTGSEEDGTLVQGLLSRDSSDSLFNHAMDGVSCSLCHQIADDGNLGSMESMTGGYTINYYAQKDDRPAYGQYENPDVLYMKDQAAFEPKHSPHIATSETCATCHNLNTQPLTADGELVEGITHFAEQAMYTEWQHSDFRVGGNREETCQGCHMPRADKPVPLASAGATQVRDDFAEHSFLGANTVMQQMMHDYREQLGIDEEVDFETSIQRNREFLTTAADVNVTYDGHEDGKLKIGVEIINNTGHKLPSGYHSRRVWLHVLVTDADGRVVYENGAMNPDGSIDGVIEDVNPHTYEPHYNIISSATQVQVYQAITQDHTGAMTHSLLAASGYLKDNRLTPSGFDKHNVPEDVAVAGVAAVDENFNLGTDLLQYWIPLDGTGSPYNVLVELNYQPFSYGHLQDLFTHSDSIDQVDAFRTIYENTSLRSETIGSGFAISPLIEPPPAPETQPAEVEMPTEETPAEETPAEPSTDDSGPSEQAMAE